GPLRPLASGGNRLEALGGLYETLAGGKVMAEDTEFLEAIAAFRRAIIDRQGRIARETEKRMELYTLVTLELNALERHARDVMPERTVNVWRLYQAGERHRWEP